MDETFEAFVKRIAHEHSDLILERFSALQAELDQAREREKELREWLSAMPADLLILPGDVLKALAAQPEAPQWEVFEAGDGQPSIRRAEAPQDNRTFEEVARDATRPKGTAPVEAPQGQEKPPHKLSANYWRGYHK